MQRNYQQPTTFPEFFYKKSKTMNKNNMRYIDKKTICQQLQIGSIQIRREKIPSLKNKANKDSYLIITR